MLEAFGGGEVDDGGEEDGDAAAGLELEGLFAGEVEVGLGEAGFEVVEGGVGGARAARSRVDAEAALDAVGEG